MNKSGIFAVAIDALQLPKPLHINNLHPLKSSVSAPKAVPEIYLKSCKRNESKFSHSHIKK
jgi:hypothetical protein